MSSTEQNFRQCERKMLFTSKNVRNCERKLLFTSQRFQYSETKVRFSLKSFRHCERKGFFTSQSFWALLDKTVILATKCSTLSDKNLISLTQKLSIFSVVWKNFFLKTLSLGKVEPRCNCRFVKHNYESVKKFVVTGNIL